MVYGIGSKVSPSSEQPSCFRFLFVFECFCVVYPFLFSWNPSAQPAKHCKSRSCGVYSIPLLHGRILVCRTKTSFPRFHCICDCMRVRRERSYGVVYTKKEDARSVAVRVCTFSGVTMHSSSRRLHVVRPSVVICRLLTVVVSLHSINLSAFKRGGWHSRRQQELAPRAGEEGSADSESSNALDKRGVLGRGQAVVGRPEETLGLERLAACLLDVHNLSWLVHCGGVCKMFDYGG